MSTRSFALIYGILFLVAGVAGFIPALVAPMDPDVQLAVPGAAGRLLGLFPVNWLHDVVHLAFGVWGLAASRAFTASRVYGRSVAIIYAALAVFGLIPGLNTLFGLVPLHAHDVWLHGVLAAGAAYFGWRTVPAAEQAGVETAATAEFRR
jgi:hypothetical protein